jgi:hypothetical protein
MRFRRPPQNLIHRSRVHFKRAIIVVLCLVSAVTPTTVSALTNAQKNLLNSGVHYFDIAGTDCSTGGDSATATSAVNLTGKDNVQKAYNFFKNNGLSDIQAAAVVGNFMQESSLNPTIREIGGNSNDPSSADPKGYGIAQWTPGSRLPGIAKANNVSGPIYELGTQLSIVIAEMHGTAPTSYKDVYSGLKKIDNLAQAVEFFRANYEAGTMGKRQEFAQGVLKDFGGTAGGSGGGAVVGIDAPSGCTSTGAVNCSNPDTSSNADTSTGALSSIRQNVVCLTQAEYKLWESGKMKPGTTDFYKYSQKRDEDWCADFASWIYNQAGYPIDNTKEGNVPAVMSIKQIGEKNDKFVYHSANGYTPIPGDLAIHIYYGKNDQITGHHVNIVMSVNKNKHSMIVIGGNQAGTSTANTSSKVSENVYSSFTSEGVVGFVSPKDSVSI